MTFNDPEAAEVRRRAAAVRRASPQEALPTRLDSLEREIVKKLVARWRLSSRLVYDRCERSYGVRQLRLTVFYELFADFPVFLVPSLSPAMPETALGLFSQKLVSRIGQKWQEEHEDLPLRWRGKALGLVLKPKGLSSGLVVHNAGLCKDPGVRLALFQEEAPERLFAEPVPQFLAGLFWEPSYDPCDE